MATPKKVQSIPLRGIVRNTPDEATEDGGLLEAINLRHKDGAWKGVYDKEYTGYQTQHADVLSPPYYHPVLPDNTYVHHNVTDNTIVTILYHATTNNTPTVHLTLANGEVFNRFAHLNNTLIVFTDLKKYLLYWNKDTQLYVDLSFLPKPIIQPYEFTNPESYEVTAVGDSIGPDPMVGITNPDYGYTDEQNWFEYLRLSVVGDYLRKVAEQKKDNRQEGFVMIRVAYKMFDGSYILASQPFMHHIGYHPSNLPLFTQELISSSPNYYAGQIEQNYFGTLAIAYNFFNTGAFTLPDHDKLGIIESLDIFSTRPIEAFDYNAKIIDWALVSGTGSSSVFCPPFNTSLIEDMIEDGQYYKVHSIPIKDIIAQSQHYDSSGLYLSEKAYHVIPDYTKDIAANELLPPDNFTHHLYNSLADYTYNSRIHLGHIITTLSQTFNNIFHGSVIYRKEPYPNGYELVDRFQLTTIRDKFLGTFITPTGLANTPKTIYCQVWLNTDEGRKVVTTELQQDYVQTYDAHNIPATYRYFVYTNGSTNNLVLNPFLSYPDYRAYKMRFYYVYSGTKYFLADYDLKSNTALNIGYYVNPVVLTDGSTGNFYPIHIALPATTGTTMPTDDPTTDDIITDSNRMQVSEQSNPYFWPAKNSYRFGLFDNSIIGIAGVQSAMSDSVFGQYPLYIFTKSGIFAIQTGNGEILYASIQHLNNEVLLKRYSLVSITGAIIFAAKEGIRIIQGGEVKELSIPVEGAITNPVNADNRWIDAVSGYNLPAVINFMSNIPFLTYIQDCIMLFDVENRELIISAYNQNELYSYVYSFYTNVWTTRTELFIGSMIIDGRMIGIKKQAVLVGTPDPPDPSLSYTGEFLDGIREGVKYGALYNWYAATDARNITSSNDWAVPTETDLDNLGIAIGGDIGNGIHLRESGTTYWTSPNAGADNSFGFNGRGTGSRSETTGGFLSLPSVLRFLSVTVVGSLCRFRELRHNSTNLEGNSAYIDKKQGASIRLVKTTTTLAHGQTGNYTGNDGKVYRTICIGTQEWLADNLAETKYRNGDTIPIVTDNSAWTALTTGAMCYYNNDIDNAITDEETTNYYTCQLVKNGTLWQNNGTKRSMNILVHKFSTTGGVTTEVTTGGFPMLMDGKLAFSGFPAISLSDFNKLSTEDFAVRMNAFRYYIESLYPNISCPFSDASLEDQTLCPLPSVPVTYSIENIVETGSDVVEFDIVTSDGSTQTIPYYLFVQRNDTDPPNLSYTKQATIEVEGDITDILLASGGMISNYKYGSLTITGGTAHIKLTISGVSNTATFITDVEGYIKFNDNPTLTVSVYLVQTDN